MIRRNELRYFFWLRRLDSLRANRRMMSIPLWNATDDVCAKTNERFVQFCCRHEMRRLAANHSETFTAQCCTMTACFRMRCDDANTLWSTDLRLQTAKSKMEYNNWFSFVHFSRRSLWIRECVLIYVHVHRQNDILTHQTIGDIRRSCETKLEMRAHVIDKIRHKFRRHEFRTRPTSPYTSSPIVTTSNRMRKPHTVRIVSHVWHIVCDWNWWKAFDDVAFTRNELISMKTVWNWETSSQLNMNRFVLMAMDSKMFVDMFLSFNRFEDSAQLSSTFRYQLLSNDIWHGWRSDGADKYAENVWRHQRWIIIISDASNCLIWNFRCEFDSTHELEWTIATEMILQIFAICSLLLAVESLCVPDGSESSQDCVENPLKKLEISKWEAKEDIEIFREYLRIPSAHPNISYGKSHKL